MKQRRIICSKSFDDTNHCMLLSQYYMRIDGSVEHCKVDNVSRIEGKLGCSFNHKWGIDRFYEWLWSLTMLTNGIPKDYSKHYVYDSVNFM